ncbi:Peptidase family M1 [Microbispora rosea]|uniref:Aminopeptidase N n=1 Tax=Microbispora rosea TaxID=58117 RepID=A0A1N7C380_9ACTN|nr:M1 family metallopeptidase [Microbispora rosea]GIH48548.1 zinc metalloprotease [Microbispora rosea subsp. rosea]SIR58091.1 Peptidase family M1 [Microbispora rosea]
MFSARMPGLRPRPGADSTRSRAPQPSGRSPRPPRRRRRGSLSALAATGALALAVSACAAAAQTGDTAATAKGDVRAGASTTDGRTPRPGAHSAGDPLFTYLGNGGYDVASYDIRYDYRAGTTKMNSSVRITATAKQALSSFSLDSKVDRVDSVSVQGERAAFTVSGEKLVITPRHALREGESFRVDVSYRVDRADDTRSPSYPPTAHYLQAWLEKDDGFAVMGQPDRAHMFFPGNDHPSDKARFTFRVTTPKNLQAVASGTLRSRKTTGDRTTYTYTTRDPIPTHVAQVAVGRFTKVTARGPHGLPIRSHLATARYKAAKAQVDDIPDQVAWVEKEIGRRYPFETYGVLGVPGDYDGVALESATLSTFSVEGLTRPAEEIVPTMIHELVHQYFGDAVSVRTWNDMWISEGHAEYYQLLYSVAKGYRKLDEVLKQRYEFEFDKRVESGPPARLKTAQDVLTGGNNGGLLMLAGLRQQVGDSVFKKIEQTFYDRYLGRSATTKDYIDVANRVSGRDLTSYIEGWLYGAQVPPMPGHPDWKRAAAPAS